MTDFVITLHREGSQWVAMCEDICPGGLAAQGATIPEALETLSIVWEAKFGKLPDLVIH